MHYKTILRPIVVLKALIGITVMVGMPSIAAYDANISGTINQLITYDSNGRFYVQLSNQPTSHPACTATYFAIDPTGDADARKMMYARALLAYALQQPINIGYDSAGNCAYNYIRIHRVG